MLESITTFNENLKEFKISTITVSTTLQYHEPLINTLRKYYKGTKFNNCLIFNLKHKESNLSIKVFVNNKLHITGCKTIETAHEISNIIVDKINEISEIGEVVEIISSEIVMINTCYKSDTNFNLKNVQGILHNNSNFKYCTYQPDKFCGLNIKCKNNLTVFIFSTGSITITGSKNSKQILETLKILKSVLNF